MNVPFNDLRAQYHTIKPEIDAAIGEILESCAYIGGPALERFEKSFAAYCGTKHGIGIASGTAALHVAFAALDIGPGDEIITTPWTFIATVEAISQTGASVRFVDCRLSDGCIDPDQLEAAITPRTKAIVPVHIFGQPADMDPIMAIANRRGVPVIEDSAQAHGAEDKGRRVGTFGRMACFSFYPGKNLGAYGDGGGIVTNDDALAARVRLLRDHGRTTKYEHQVEGYNYRLDGLQAAVLDVKLRHLEAWTEARRRFAARYDALLAGCEDIVPIRPRSGVRHVYHLYVVRVQDREALLPLVAKRGVGVGVHYPIPLHLQPAYRHLGFARGAFPNAERLAGEVMSLPMYAEMDPSAPEYVVSVLRELVAARA
ncbi:MAG: DegT/DnrJ/EryC1/StrS family aminotransferase [bacterium]